MTAPVLFATDRMHLPDDLSGSVQTTHALLRGLASRGYSCELLATLPSGLRYTVATLLFRLSASRVIPQWRDDSLGYTVCRGSEWRFAQRVRRRLAELHPRALVLDSIRQLRRLDREEVDVSCPIVLCVHDVRFLDEARSLPYADRVTCIANSPFTADQLHAHFGIEPRTVAPVVEFACYRTTRARARYVTMVSPTAQKGIDTSLHLARAFPDVPFLFVEGWPMSREDWKRLSDTVGELPNVTLRRATGDMRTVYEETRVLLVPTTKRGETFGRVIVEAQASGIPVVVRDAGAMRWVVGDGGVTIDREAPDEAWVSPLRDILFNRERYEALSALSIANTERSEFSPERIIDAFENIVTSA